MPSVRKALTAALKDLGGSYKTLTRVKSDSLREPTLGDMWKETYKKQGIKGVAQLAGHAVGMFVPGAQLIYIPSHLFVRASRHYKTQKLNHLTNRLQAQYGYEFASAQAIARTLLFGEDSEMREEDIPLNKRLMADIANGNFDPEA